MSVVLFKLPERSTVTHTLFSPDTRPQHQWEALRAMSSPHPSRMDSRQQYKLSNFCLVTESLTFMAGTQSFPAFESWYNLRGHMGGGGGRGGRVQPDMHTHATSLSSDPTRPSTFPSIWLIDSTESCSCTAAVIRGRALSCFSTGNRSN